MNSKKRFAALAAGIASLGLLLSPTAATAAQKQEPAVQVVEVPMSWDCSGFTEADRQKAVREQINVCGALDQAQGKPQSRVRITGDCGTAMMYIQKNGDGNRVVSWGMSSTAGPMIGRAINVSWTGGGFYDLSPMWQTDYSNSRVVKSKTKIGGTINGNVTIYGWKVSCSVYSYSNPV